MLEYFIHSIKQKQSMKCSPSRLVSNLLARLVEIFYEPIVAMSNCALHELNTCHLVPCLFHLDPAGDPLQQLLSCFLYFVAAIVDVGFD